MSLFFLLRPQHFFDRGYLASPAEAIKRKRKAATKPELIFETPATATAQAISKPALAKPDLGDDEIAMLAFLLS